MGTSPSTQASVVHVTMMPIDGQRAHTSDECWCGANHGSDRCPRCEADAATSAFLVASDRFATRMAHRCPKRHKWITDFPMPAMVVDLRACDHMHAISGFS